MPYIITKKNGKPYKLPGKPTARDIPVWSRDDVGSFSRDGKANGDCWTLTNVVTRRSIHVGACKRETPGDLWGARGRRRRGRGFRDAAPAAAAPSAAAPVAQKPTTPAMAGFFDKIFGKKPAKRNPMSRRIYMIKTKSGTYIPAGVASMQGARRRRKRRRR